MSPAAPHAPPAADRAPPRPRHTKPRLEYIDYFECIEWVRTQLLSPYESMGAWRTQGLSSMSSLKSEGLKILKFFFIFCALAPHAPAPPPPPPPRVHDTEGGAAGVGFCDDLRWRAPVVVGVVAAGEGGQVIPASRSNFFLFLRSRTRPH
jgi:hypothetical protein